MITKLQTNVAKIVASGLCFLMYSLVVSYFLQELTTNRVRNEIEKEAISLGHARYSIDINKKITFEWITNINTNPISTLP